MTPLGRGAGREWALWADLEPPLIVRCHVRWRLLPGLDSVPEEESDDAYRRRLLAGCRGGAKATPVVVGSRSTSLDWSTLFTDTTREPSTGSGHSLFCAENARSVYLCRGSHHLSPLLTGS